MAELGDGLNHVTAIRQELEVLVIIANRWVTEFLVVEFRRASSGDFKVRFGEICLHAGEPVSLTQRRQGARRLLKYWSGPRAGNGCVDFGAGRRCSLGRDRCGYRRCA